MIDDNAALATVNDLAALQTIGGRLVVVLNPSLPQADALAWGDAIDVRGVRKIAGNKDAGPPLDPCPWFEDGECDEPTNGSGICGEDLDGDDCCPGYCE